MAGKKGAQLELLIFEKLLVFNWICWSDYLMH